jgi:Flp pilus assembly protein TadD
MKSKLKLMFCFVCLAGLYAGFVHAQGIGDRNRPAGRGTYKIVGKVYLPDGRPAPEVEVRADGAEMNSGSSTRTGIDGEFAISGLSSGNYTVIVNQKGYQTETESVTIAEGMIGGSTYQLAFNLRLPGQKKGDIYSMNPLFKDVPKTAIEKFKKGADKMRANDAKGAIPFLEAAVVEHPAFAAAYYELGVAYLKTNDLDNALASFVKAIQSKPDYTEAKYFVGYTQYLKNNLEVAAAVFDDVLKIKETPDAHYYLGLSLAKLHNADAAIPHLKAAIAKKDDETTALAHRFLGAIYMQKKQNAEAAAELQRYLDLVPKAPDADKLKMTIADLKKGS